MLILSRKLNEEIMVGDDIVICVVEINGSRVRLGVKAPKDVLIHRSEVFDAIQREKQSSDSSES